MLFPLLVFQQYPTKLKATPGLMLRDSSCWCSRDNLLLGIEPRPPTHRAHTLGLSISPAQAYRCLQVVKDAHVKPYLYKYFYGAHWLFPTLPRVIVIMSYVQQVTQHTALDLCYRRTEAAAIHFPQRVVGTTESRTTIVISVLE